MLPRVVEVKPRAEGVLAAAFSDGRNGTARFSDAACFGIFAPLRDPAFLARAFVDHGAVTWPNGADLAPDAMHAEIGRHGEMVVDSSHQPPATSHHARRATGAAGIRTV